MGFSLSILDQVRVASPCNAAWADMPGDDRVRFCDLCCKNVYNLTDMRRDEAEDLILEKEGHLCVRYHARRDGTILTSDCPVGLRWAQQRLRKVGLLCSAFLLMILQAAWALGVGGGQRKFSLRELQPFAYFFGASPARTTTMGDLMGSIAFPLPRTTPSGNGTLPAGQDQVRNDGSESNNDMQAGSES